MYGAKLMDLFVRIHDNGDTCYEHVVMGFLRSLTEADAGQLNFEHVKVSVKVKLTSRSLEFFEILFCFSSSVRVTQVIVIQIINLY